MSPRMLSHIEVKEFTLYKVKISLGLGNPPFWCLLLVGYINEKTKAPGGYSKLVGTDVDEIDSGFSQIACYELIEICDINFDYP